MRRAPTPCARTSPRGRQVPRARRLPQGYRPSRPAPVPPVPPSSAMPPPRPCPRAQRLRRAGGPGPIRPAPHRRERHRRERVGRGAPAAGAAWERTASCDRSRIGRIASRQTMRRRRAGGGPAMGRGPNRSGADARRVARRGSAARPLRLRWCRVDALLSCGRARHAAPPSTSMRDGPGADRTGRQRTRPPRPTDTRHRRPPSPSPCSPPSSATDSPPDSPPASPPDSPPRLAAPRRP